LSYQLTDDDVRWAEEFLKGFLVNRGLRHEKLEDVKQDLMVFFVELAQVWRVERNTPFRPWANTMLRWRWLSMLHRRGYHQQHHGLPDSLVPTTRDEDRTPIRERVALIRAACRTDRERDIVELLPVMTKVEIAEMLGITKQRVGQITDRIRERVLRAEEGA
jgi:RNA polymerase sigma factor (sigma-70 family)